MNKQINPYLVPPFKTKTPTVFYYWWSWHPRYPYWSQSCWGGDSLKEAQQALVKANGSLDYYHNKLIKQDGNKFTEIEDRPCKRLDIWQDIARKPRRETDAKPIGGWDK